MEENEILEGAVNNTAKKATKASENTTVETPVVETPTVDQVADYLILDEAKALEINVISLDTPYTKGKRAERGVTFNVYSYNEVAFIVDSNMPFVEDQRKGLLHTVKLKQGTREKTVVNEETGAESIVTVPTLQFISSVSSTAKINAESNKTRLAMLANLAKAPINETMLSFLLNNA